MVVVAGKLICYLLKELEGGRRCTRYTDRQAGFFVYTYPFLENSSQSETWVAMYIYLSVHIFEFEKEKQHKIVFELKDVHIHKNHDRMQEQKSTRPFYICNAAAAAVKAVKMRRNGGVFNGWKCSKAKRNEEGIRNNQKVLIWTIYKHAISLLSHVWIT